MVAPCDYDQPYCVTERMAEWTHRGKQEHHIKRYCSKEKFESSEGEVGICNYGGRMAGGGTTFDFKDCYVSCDGDFCNKGDSNIWGQF